MADSQQFVIFTTEQVTHFSNVFLLILVIFPVGVMNSGLVCSW